MNRMNTQSMKSLAESCSNPLAYQNPFRTFLNEETPLAAMGDRLGKPVDLRAGGPGQAQAQGAPVAHLAPTGTPPPTQNDPTWNGYPTREIDGVLYYWWEGYGPNQNTNKWRSRRPPRR